MSAETWGCEGVNQAKTRRDKTSQYREQHVRSQKGWENWACTGGTEGAWGRGQARGGWREASSAGGSKEERGSYRSQPESGCASSISKLFWNQREGGTQANTAHWLAQNKLQNMSSLPYPGTAKINKNGSSVLNFWTWFCLATVSFKNVHGQQGEVGKGMWGNKFKIKQAKNSWLETFSLDRCRNGHTGGTVGDRTEVGRAWNSLSNQDPDARQVVKLPLPHLHPHGLSEDRVCQPPPNTRPTPQSHSRLKALAWATLMPGKQNVLLAKS